MSPAILVALAAAVLGPVLTYLAAARRLSGKIDTSEAAKLWDEAGKLRAEYKTEVSDLRDIVDKLRTRVSDLEDRNEELHLENGELRAEVKRLREENRRLRARIAELEKRERERGLNERL